MGSSSQLTLTRSLAWDSTGLWRNNIMPAQVTLWQRGVLLEQTGSDYVVILLFKAGFYGVESAWLETDAGWPSPESIPGLIECKLERMKHSNSIRTFIQLGALALATGWVQTLSAFNYTNSNLLLVFRKDNFNDVEFNLGNVSNYLGKADGTVITVTNWSLPLVKATYNNSLLNVKFLLAAVTTSDDTLKRAWLTDANPTGAPADITQSRWSGIYSKISNVGDLATAATFTNSSQVYITNATESSSFTAIASGGGSLDASTLGGSSPFPLEIENPATNRFVELKVSTVTPKPASTIVGTFALTSAGVLTFVAGAPAAALTSSHIQGIARAGNVNSVTFTTASGANYRLRYHTDLVPGISGWTILPGSVAGDGSAKILTDTTTDARRFYAVEAYH